MTPTHARTQRPTGPFSRGIALSLALSMLGAPASSLAQQPAGAQQDEGRLRFKRGVELFKEGDFRAALVEFKRAYEVAPSYRILYNLGQTSYELQDYAGALVAFERYLKEGGAELPADRRAEVEAEVKKLQGRVAYLTIEVNEPGALISVDDVQVGTSPIKEPLLVSAGQRRVAASRPPLLPASQLIELAGGDRTKLHLELINPAVRSPSTPPSLPPASSSQAPAATPPPAPPPPPSSAGLWLGLGATLLLTGGAVTTGLLARSSQQDRDRELGRLPGDRSKIDSLADRAKNLALASDIMSGLALVGAGVTVYFAVRPGGTTTARVSPGGASLAVTF